MFPSFTSLADREQKQHELLAKAERRVKQSAIKRSMYAATIWASDANKTVDLKSKSAPAETSEPASEPMTQIDPLKCTEQQ